MDSQPGLPKRGDRVGGVGCVAGSLTEDEQAVGCDDMVEG